MSQKEFQICISLLLILPTFNQLINGLFSFISTCSKEPFRNQYLENKTDAKISSINSKVCFMSHFVEVYCKKIN